MYFLEMQLTNFAGMKEQVLEIELLVSQDYKQFSL